MSQVTRLLALRAREQGESLCGDGEFGASHGESGGGSTGGACGSQVHTQGSPERDQAAVSVRGCCRDRARWRGLAPCPQVL